MIKGKYAERLQASNWRYLPTLVITIIAVTRHGHFDATQANHQPSYPVVVKSSFRRFDLRNGISERLSRFQLQERHSSRVSLWPRRNARLNGTVSLSTARPASRNIARPARPTLSIETTTHRYDV